MFGKKKNRTAVVIGLGEFGLHLALSLSKCGCDCIVADIDAGKIDSIKNFVMKAIIADASQKNALYQIVPADADFVIIALGDIESSITAALYLKDMKIENVYVKAISEEHERILKMMEVKNIIFPEKDMGQRFATKLMSNNLLDFLPLSEDYSVAELAPLSSMANKSLKEIDFRKEHNLSIIAIKELVPPNMVISPSAGFKIKISDILVVLGKKDAIEAYNQKTH
ncbi:MAG TPA: TrkA family potassium uptake protein [bacterium]|nr:TrkA family potassium uptake protein [bacterium]HPM45741.1 TrkA family potassium uptake protein [bacterium]HRQ68693.1 TrkA family potassium uptake protein [bacterium]